MQPNRTDATRVPDPALRLAARRAGAAAALVVPVGVATLPTGTLAAAAAVGALAGGATWTLTWLVDQHHVRAARIAWCAATATVAVLTALGVLVIALGAAAVPLVGVLAAATGIVLAVATVRGLPSSGAR